MPSIDILSSFYTLLEKLKAKVYNRQNADMVLCIDEQENHQPSKVSTHYRRKSDDFVQHRNSAKRADEAFKELAVYDQNSLHFEHRRMQV